MSALGNRSSWGKVSQKRAILKCHFTKGLGHEHFLYPQPDFLEVLHLGKNPSFYTIKFMRELDRVC